MKAKTLIAAFVIAASAVCAQTPVGEKVNCDHVNTLQGSAGIANLQGGSSVRMDCDLGGQSTTRLTASDKIVLTDGFRAREGSQFNAFITGQKGSNKASEVLTGSDENVSVYPNPTNGSVYVVTNFGTYDPVQVSVTDLLGKVVYATRQRDQQALSYSFDGLPKGLYFVRVQFEDRTVVEKIIYQ
jgi:hypothetical protein